MEDYIKKGDKVNIYWEHLTPELGVIITYFPQAAGESYSLKREDETVFDVLLYSKMERVSLEKG